MSTGVIVQLTILAVFLVATVFVARRGTRPSEADIERLDAAWSDAYASESSGVQLALLKMSRPLAGLPGQAIKPTSSTYQQLQEKLLATGSRLYGGSVDVFLSFQVLMFLIGAALVALSLIFSGGKEVVGGAVFMAVVLSAWPYNRVSDLAKKRAEKVTAALPAFAELLIIPIRAGKSVVPAMKFTAEKVDNVVADEVNTLVRMIESRSVPEEIAFESAGKRLGGQAAPVFMNSLYEAHAQGVAIADALATQAEQLRYEDHQRRRALLKKLPNKMVFVIALHLMPFLFAITLLPTFYSLGNM